MNNGENRGDGQNKDVKTLCIDVEYYQSFLDDMDISEDKKLELIETLWGIVRSFVDLGFGVHPVQAARQNAAKEREAQLPEAITKMIAETANQDSNTHSNRTLTEAWPERTDV